MKPQLSGIFQVICPECRSGLTPDCCSPQGLQSWINGNLDDDNLPPEEIIAKKEIIKALEEEGGYFINYDFDLRKRRFVIDFFKEFGGFDLVVHTAAQPSHDWAAREPFTDFDVNATATMNLLEAFRLHSPEGVFIFTSTNKVYGDNPNKLVKNLLSLENCEDIVPIIGKRFFIKSG